MKIKTPIEKALDEIIYRAEKETRFTLGQCDVGITRGDYLGYALKPLLTKKEIEDLINYLKG